MYNIHFISGSMFGGKSKLMIKLISDSISSHESILILKPHIDTRDGLFIASRDHKIKYSASKWDTEYKPYFIYKLETEKIDKIYIDECHFLSLEDVTFIAEACKKHDISLYFSGLETDFKEKFFESSLWIKNNSNFYIFKHGECSCCGEKLAVYNILFGEDGFRVTNGDSIHVGDSEYIVLCEACLK